MKPLVMAMVVAALVWGAAPAHAGDPCGAALAGNVCPAPPQGGRRMHLRNLDQQARRDVAREDFEAATRTFACLLKLDPTAETAMNLAIVAEASGDVPRAFQSATCAEQLAEGPARERAAVERARLQALVPATAEPPVRAPTDEAVAKLPPPIPMPRPETQRDAAADLTATLPPAPPERWSALQRAAVIGGALALAAGGALFVSAHVRGAAFQERQRSHGYDDRAQSLRSEAATLQTASAVSAALGAATIGIVWLTF